MKIIMTSIVALSLLGQNASLEPDALGVIFSIDKAETTLTRLEKQIAFAKKVRRESVTTSSIAIEAQVKGEKSSVRLNADSIPQFVVKLTAAGDPAKFRLYGFDIRKGLRVVTLSVLQKKLLSQKSAAKDRTFDFDVKKVGENVYRIVPAAKLPPGEYGFTTNDPQVAFCFGIE